MKLSVILPCFNGAATVATQLEALTRQAWPGGWEVIVVDNGSTDSSMTIVQAFRDRLPGLQIVQAYTPGTRRLGVPHSYNVGIKAASGEAFVFAEADDEVATGWLTAMGKALAEHPFVVARLEHRKLNPEWLHPPYGDGYQYDGLYRDATPPRFLQASAAGFGLQRSLYQAVGAFSIEFPIAHDQEYCWRAQSAGYGLHFEPAAMVHYRERSDLRARYLQGRNWGRDSARLERHYGWAPGRFAVSRQLLWILRSAPGGLGAAALVFVAPLKGRQLLADWVWNAGWSLGKLEALRTLSSVPVRAMTVMAGGAAGQSEAGA
ncbi:MAG TPA: glycosyltransferase family 2 protein [Ramlibacter sp.]|nr:glycosyltransferase family 2 protein [Ramlibacter sp.]